MVEKHSQSEANKSSSTNEANLKKNVKKTNESDGDNLELSEEDRQKKEEFDLLVERVQDKRSSHTKDSFGNTQV
eukprot:jgi/Galph1/391/GphlegSOOS_G5073.1